MLEKLHIRNYAIIEELDIVFGSGLNIITGETGAGKSILMGALNLVLGERADTAVLLQSDKKCVVEAVFSDWPREQVAAFFTDNDLDMEEDIRIRREIGSNGKSRSFVNDTPVNLSQLKKLSTFLVDLHQQFDTLELETEDFQREALDAFSGQVDRARIMTGQFAQYERTRKALDALQKSQQQANLEADYHRFLFDELDALQLREHEAEELEAESNVLSNADAIQQQLSDATHLLSDSEEPLVQQLKSLINRLYQWEQQLPSLTPLVKRLQAAQVELVDIAGELSRLSSQVESNPARLQKVEERLSVLFNLFRKHSVKDTTALIELREQLALKLQGITNLAAEIDALKKSLAGYEAICMSTAAELSVARKSSAGKMAEQVSQLLSLMGMPNARLRIDVNRSDLSLHGADEIVFLFDANKTGRFEPVRKVASGGELSRLMLGIKSLVASRLSLPTLIFDEIDTGISGEAARQVGLIMKEMSAGHQLIAITHQAQIAAKAKTHFFVYKKEEQGRMVTMIRQLGQEERVEAIAKMLSGEKPTAAALANARELVVG